MAKEMNRLPRINEKILLKRKKQEAKKRSKQAVRSRVRYRHCCDHEKIIQEIATRKSRQEARIKSKALQ